MELFFTTSDDKEKLRLLHGSSVINGTTGSKNSDSHKMITAMLRNMLESTTPLKLIDQNKSSYFEPGISMNQLYEAVKESKVPTIGYFDVSTSSGPMCFRYEFVDQEEIDIENNLVGHYMKIVGPYILNKKRTRLF